MKFTVLHAVAKDGDARFGMMFSPNVELIKKLHGAGRLDYFKVAEVETSSIADVFQLTNTIDDRHPWWENHGVKKFFTALGCRSTSVGDIITFHDGRYCKLIAPVSLDDIDPGFVKNITKE